MNVLVPDDHSDGSAPPPDQLDCNMDQHQHENRGAAHSVDSLQFASDPVGQGVNVLVPEDQDGGGSDCSDNDCDTVYVQFEAPRRRRLLSDECGEEREIENDESELGANEVDQTETPPDIRPAWTHARKCNFSWLSDPTADMRISQFSLPFVSPPTLGGSCALTQGKRMPTLAELDPNLSASFDAMSLLSA